MATNDIPARRYSDFRVDAAPNPITGDLAAVTNGQAVKRAVRNLLFTGKYERPFRPLLGSGLQKYLFENVSPVTAELIRQSIVTTIRNHEPRAKLIAVRVQVTPDGNSYSATIKFGVENLPEVIEVEHVLERVR